MRTMREAWESLEHRLNDALRKRSEDATVRVHMSPGAAALLLWGRADPTGGLSWAGMPIIVDSRVLDVQVVAGDTNHRPGETVGPYPYDPRTILRAALVAHIRTKGDAPILIGEDGRVVIAGEMIRMLDESDPAALQFLVALTGAAISLFGVGRGF